MFNVTGTFPGPCTPGVCCVSTARTLVAATRGAASGAAAETPEIFRNVRRDMPDLEDDGLELRFLSFLSGRSSTGVASLLISENESILSSTESTRWRSKTLTTEARRHRGTEKKLAANED